MKSQFSLSDLSLAIVMFAVTATMHEATRTERLMRPGTEMALFEWTDLLRLLW